MAWAERLRSGKWRGGWRTPDGTKGHTKKSTHPEHPWARKRDALDAAQEAEVRANRRASIQVGAASASIMWGDYWDTTRQVRDDTETARFEDAVVRLYIRPRWGGEPLNRIKQRDVKAWALDLQVKHDLSYARNIYGVFRASINAAMEADPPLLDASPCAGVRMPKRPRGKKPVKDERGVDKLRPYLKDCYQRLVDFGDETGLRPGEMSGLHLDALDLESGWATVEKTFVNRLKLIRHSPKDEDSRDVPLTQKAIEIVREAIAGRVVTEGCGVPHVHRGKPAKRRCRSALVFVNDQGNPVTVDAYWAALQKAAAKAQVKPIKPYDSRHWFITRALDGGLDLVTVAEIVGHADVKLTQEYKFRTDTTRDRLRVALGERNPLTVVQSGSVESTEESRETEAYARPS